MIAEIRLSNFFSICDEITLDMRASNSPQSKQLIENTFTIGKEKLLKSACIYGANAAGKSNIIEAIRFCCMLILESDTFNEDKTFPYSKFKFANMSNQPSSFFICFYSDNIWYEYSFTLSQNSVLTEELYYYPSGRKAKVFTRNADDYSFGSAIKSPREVARNTSSKTLFLSRASQFNREIAKIIHRYFNETFLLDSFNLDPEDVFGLFTQYKEPLLTALRTADSSIRDIELELVLRQKKESDIIDSKDDDNNEKHYLKVMFYHKYAEGVAIGWQEESGGTRKLFVLLLNILNVIQNKKVILIDEIETSLHSEIVSFIFNLFHREDTQAQLICTTHNTNLLNSGDFLKEQIIFVNKMDDTGASDIYSLYDFKDFRKGLNVEKAYLQGRFDAVPKIAKIYR